MLDSYRNDTIAAIATPPGAGGIGIIRISGEEAEGILRCIFRPHRPVSSFRPRHLYYGTVHNPAGAMLDEVLAVFMPAPHSYTTEDVVEIQSHSTSLVLHAILEVIFALGVRPAAPGEFTKRAFLGGRIDLTKAEAVIDLLTAETAAGMRLALDQMHGSLLHEVEQLRHVLLEILAVLEVAIDFPDEDEEIIDHAGLLQTLREKAVLPLRDLLGRGEQGRIIREGIKVVIVGRPNVGKSSLLNALLREERALVTDIPGTTRDTIEEVLSVRGIPVHLIDTAGIREHADQVEELGIARARRKLDEADLVLFVVDASETLHEEDRMLFTAVQGKQHIVVCNKEDKSSPQLMNAYSADFRGTSMVRMSALHAAGVDQVLEEIYRAATTATGLVEQPACAPNQRHRAALTLALQACMRLDEALLAQLPVDCAAVEVQGALDSLAEIVGLTAPDDVLDVIFSRFCLGK